MIRNPLKDLRLCCQGLLLLMPLLSPSYYYDVSAARVSKAATRLSAELGKAHRLTAKLSRQGSVTPDEKRRLDIQLSEAYRRASTLAYEVSLIEYGRAEQGSEMDGSLAGDFGELVAEMIGLRQTISGLASQSAQKSYGPFLETLGEEVGALAKALRCEMVGDGCVKCSDGVVRCPPKK
jgi:hypothetical protein